MRNFKFYSNNVTSIQPGSIIKKNRGLLSSYFLVQSKENNYFIGYKIKDIKRNPFTYTFDRHHRIDLSNLTKFKITKPNYYIYELNKNDIRNLNSVIFNIQSKYDVQIRQIQLNDTTFYLIGDVIIINNNFYYIYQIIDNKVICFELKKEKGFIHLPIKNKLYSLDLDKQFIFSYSNNSYKVFYHCKEDLIEEINFYIHKQYPSIQEGSIFNRNDQLYYTYQVDKDIATCFRLYLNDMHKGNELFKEEFVYQNESYYILVNEPIQINIKNLTSIYLFNLLIRKEIDLQVKKTKPYVQIGSILQYSKSHAFIIYKIDEEYIYGFEINQNKINFKNRTKINKNICSYLVKTINQLDFLSILFFYYYKFIHRNSNCVNTYFFNDNEFKNYAIDFYDTNNSSCKKNRQLLFDCLVEGDVILAQTNKENNINKSYLVMKIFKNSILAFPISLNKDNDTKYLSYYFLSNNNYSPYNSCYVHLKKYSFIHKNKINKICYALNDHDWHNIERRVVASKIKGFSDIITSHIENILVEEGDIYLYENELWYAYKIEHDNITSYKVKLENFEDAIVINDNHNYYLNKNIKKIIPLQLASSTIAILPKKIINEINKIID